MIKKKSRYVFTYLLIIFLIACSSEEDSYNPVNDNEVLEEQLVEDNNSQDTDLVNKFSLLITISPDSTGTLNIYEGEFDEGTEVELVVTPKSLYRFKEWQGDLTGATNPYNLKMDRDKTITAVFEFNDLDKTYVPDDNFEQALIDKGYDDVMDDYVLTSSIDTITSLFVTNRNIINLTGIQDFVSLKVLNCGYNELGSLDISNNKELTDLYCSDNQLNELNLSANQKIEMIFASNNQITSLDLSNNKALERIYVHSNMLSSLNTDLNITLKSIYCDNNQIQALELSKNTELINLFCSGNQLSSLDVSANTELIQLNVAYNILQTLDLSENPRLSSMHCNNNQLVWLSLKNGSNERMPGLPDHPHDTFFGIRFDNNPSLTCAAVDDAIKANEGAAPYMRWEKDDRAVYSEGCD
jgi:hypothetical protein